MKKKCFLLFFALVSFSLKGQDTTSVRYAPPGMPVPESVLADTLMLDASVVSARSSVMIVVEDTLSYNPAAFKLPEDAMLEDLLRKIPGLSIDGGSVTLHGKEITELYVDGRRFFGGNVKTGLKSLAADMVDKVNAYERESDFSRISGIDDGEKEPVLDIRIKESKLKGLHTSLTGGYGSSDRYNARLNANRLTKKENLTLLYSQRNISYQSGVYTTSRSQVGTGSAGDRTTREGGLTWGRKSKKLDIDLTLHYDGTDREADSDSRVQSITSSLGQTFTFNKAGTHALNDAVKGDLTLEWKPDKRNTLYFKPRFKYGTKGTLTRTEGAYYSGDTTASKLSNNTRNLTNTYTDSYEAEATLQYTHRFAKKGRSLTLKGNFKYTGSLDNQFLDYQTRYYKIKRNPDSLLKRPLYFNVDNGNLFSNVQLSYSEPVFKRIYLQATVRADRNLRNSVRNNYLFKESAPDWMPLTVLDLQEAMMNLPQGYEDMLSSQYSYVGRYDYKAIAGTLNLRYVTKKLAITAGATVRSMDTHLEWDQLGVTRFSDNQALHVAPTVNLRFNPRKNCKLSFHYNNWTGTPTLYQLVPVENSTNPLYVHSGNKDLKPSLTHNLKLSFNVSNFLRQSSLVVNATMRITDDQPTDIQVYDEESGVRTTSPVNLSGNWKSTGSIVYNKTLPDSRFSITNQCTGEYNNNVSYLYNSKRHESELNRTTRLMVKEYFQGSFRNDWVEMELDLKGEYTSEKSFLRPMLSQDPFNLSAGLNTTFFLPRGMRLSTDFTYMVQRGYAYGELNRNYMVWNASIAQSLFRKKATVTLLACDMLGQLNNLTRSFGATSRSIVLYNGCNRYILLKFAYRFTVR